MNSIQLHFIGVHRCASVAVSGLLCVSRLRALFFCERRDGPKKPQRRKDAEGQRRNAGECWPPMKRMSTDEFNSIAFYRCLSVCICG